MIPEKHHTLLVTCRLGPVQKAALAETISDRAAIVFLDELDATSRRAALSSATVLLAHNTAKELRGSELELIGGARLIQFLAAGLDFIPLDQLPAQVPHRGEHMRDLRTRWHRPRSGAPAALHGSAGLRDQPER